MGRKNHKKHKHSTGLTLVKGTLEITRSGLGYVLAEDGNGDVLVRPHEFNKAFNGDKVAVRITRPSYGEKKREGAVVDVVSRKQTDFIGTLKGHPKRWFFIPDTDKPMPHFDLAANPAEELKDGDKVVVRLQSWDAGERRPTGLFLEKITQENLGDMAMKSLLLEKGFSLSFSDEAMEEAGRMTENITEKELKRRKDFRGTLTFTIDPVDAKDFDDAISFKKLKKGLYEIGVHIADVSHFVEEDTTLDEEAYSRATSVYLPDRVNPMLPEKISNELCSLRPNEDKYTFSAVFQINDKAEVKKHWIGRTVIHSNHRFTYEDAQQIIETGEGQYKEEVLLLNDLGQKFRKKRFKNGAINFSSQEVRFKLDDNGKPIGVMVKESKEAHQLIEEFMLLANRTVAEEVSKITVKDKPVPFPYRIHDTPDEEKLVPFTALARKFGYDFNLADPDSIAASFNAMLEAAKGTPQQHLLEQLGIRTMAKAVYTAENIGHYGLGFENYCHFTSPIRRYPDVMVHRILQQVLDGKVTVDKKMESKCKHCSERERAAMECERAGNKYKQVEFMMDFIGEEFDAVITGVSGFGFWAETVAQKCEGLVSLKDLNYYDDFRLIESDYTLVGAHSGRKFRIGDMVRIKVVSANLERRQLDYEWIAQPGTAAAPTRTGAEPLKQMQPATGSKTEKRKKGKKAGERESFNASWLDEEASKLQASRLEVAKLLEQEAATKTVVSEEPPVVVEKKAKSPKAKKESAVKKEKPIQPDPVVAIAEPVIEGKPVKKAAGKKSAKAAATQETSAVPTVTKKAKAAAKPAAKEKPAKAKKPVPDTAPIPDKVRRKMK